MRSLLLLCVLVLAAGRGVQPAGAQDAEKPVLTVHIHGDNTVYDEATGHTEVTGNVRILAYTNDPDSPRLAIRAEAAHYDMRGQVLEAHGSILMRTDQAAFRGEDLHFDLRTDEMRLTKVAVSVDFPREDGQVLRGYFYGDEIKSEAGSQFVIINGMVTPCDSPYKPDVGAGASRIVYDSTTGKATVYRGKLYFLGLPIPLLPKLSFDITGDPTSQGQELAYSCPGYSGYDGLYIPFQYEFTEADSPWLGTVSGRLATRSHFCGVASLVRDSTEYDLGSYAGRQEPMTDDITRRLAISRLPEIRYVRHFDMGQPHADWETGVSLGRFHERDEDPSTAMRSDERLSVWADYARNLEQKKKRDGTWWGATLTQNFYGRGTRFRDLSVEAGIGGRLSDDLSASLVLTRHHLDGQSPFFFDDVYIESEAYATLGWKMSHRWAFHSDGRYDLKRSSLRDYTLELSRRSRYLTWSASYDFSDKSIGLRVDINGLTGDTDPPDTEPVVSEEQVQLTPEWVHEGAIVDMQ